MRKEIIEFLGEKLEPVFSRYGITDCSSIDVQVPPDKSKGDFSLNAAMKYCKAAGCPPRKLAEELVEALSESNDWCNRVEIAGPGFINLYLKDDKISQLFNERCRQAKLQLPTPAKIENIVIDYSSVNIAKQMHVGHLRSTIIGDVLARVNEALGHKVIRQNHLGDWGLPMAMVLWKAEKVIEESEKSGTDLKENLNLATLEKLYKEAAAECKEDKQAAKICHDYLIRLQQSEPKLLDNWHKIIRISMAEVYRIYELLDVKLTEESERGESFYRDRLADTVELLQKSGVVTESQGAQCVFLDEFKGKDGNPLPVIVQKSDGGYNYGTFDLAALRYRTSTLDADRIVYVTDARQALHFKQVFEVAKIGKLLAKPDVKLEHVTFGTILGEDNKPLKTRSGENVKLADLLDEAIDKALQVVNEKNPTLSDEYKKKVAQMVGVGAIKYADLSQNRNNDYVFSFDRMLALNGNTSPYLQYAHARICSIFRKAQIDFVTFCGESHISEPQERDLMLKLMEFGQIVENVAQELRPHVLCNYLYELASCFSVFYDKCKVIGCEGESLQQSRLNICMATRRTLEHGLDLLGISAPQEM